VLLGAGYLALAWSGALDHLQDPAALRRTVLSAGWAGGAAVVGLMAIAIVMSPLPSAPIALAAGMVYGHTFGTVLVLAGAELGALIAFAIARRAGRAAVERWLGRAGVGRLEGSQGTLMAIVFITRLMPFISFDAVSYAAGVTPLSLWRFALATLAGILPASFLLAHFGAELTSAEAGRASLALLALGGVVLAPLVLRLIKQLRRR
jgi:uncharacterized membrane protein YdjX (TVP38/TMEM64 family)